jgi:hypothetical protein
MHRYYFIVALILFMLSSCAKEKPSVDDRKEQIQAIEASVTANALARKERSDARLASEGVPVNKHLPAIEDVDQIKQRNKEEIAWRAMALLVVAAKGRGLEQATVENVVKDYQLDSHFTPAERAFVQNKSPTDHDRIQFSWRYEAAWTLLWSLGYVEELSKPSTICDVERAEGFLIDRGPEQFIKDAKLRPIENILDEADLIYRYHWAVVDARVNNKPAPAVIEPGVTMERHHALNWLIGYMDQEWDDVSTDT